jgi:hypothetical protein
LPGRDNTGDGLADSSEKPPGVQLG